MSLRVSESRGHTLRISYGNDERFTISSELLGMIDEANTSLDRQSADYSDELVRRVKERIGDDSRLRLELAIYGRVVLGMHPSDLTGVTCGISSNEARPYRAISLQVGKKKQKAAGVR